MTFIAKALIGITAVVIPSSIGATVAYRDSLFGSSSTNNKVDISEPDLSDLKSRCYILPIESDKGEQLLVCTDKDSSTTGNGKNDYFYRENSGKNTKVKTINKKEDNLEISLEGNNTQEKITLKIVGGNWSKIQNLEDLNDCELTPRGEGATFQCMSGDDIQDITLIKFQG